MPSVADYLDLLAPASVNKAHLLAALQGQSWSSPQAGRLTLSGATLLLSPYKGNGLVINSRLEQIPDAGVTLAVGAAAASTLYYIYAYMSAGVMTLEFSTTTHATQAGTGVEIKSGDATRSLVGMARTTAGTAWADTDAQRFVLSWFNPRPLRGTAGFSALRSTSSAPMVEVHTEIRVEYLTWAGVAVQAKISGSVNNNTAGSGTYTAIGWDGVTANGSSQLTIAAGVSYYDGIGCADDRTDLSEGYHYVTLMGAAGANTANWSGGGNPQTQIHIVIQG